MSPKKNNPGCKAGDCGCPQSGCTILVDNLTTDTHFTGAPAVSGVGMRFTTSNPQQARACFGYVDADNYLFAIVTKNVYSSGTLVKLGTLAIYERVAGVTGDPLAATSLNIKDDGFSAYGLTLWLSYDGYFTAEIDGSTNGKITKAVEHPWNSPKIAVGTETGLFPCSVKNPAGNATGYLVLGVQFFSNAATGGSGEWVILSSLDWEKYKGQGFDSSCQSNPQVCDFGSGGGDRGQPDGTSGTVCMTESDAWFAVNGTWDWRNAGSDLGPTTGYAGAIARLNQPHPDLGVQETSVTADVFGTDDGDQPYVWTGNGNAAECYFAVLTVGTGATLELFVRTDGSATSMGSVSVTAANSTVYSVTICRSQSRVSVSLAGTVVLSRYKSAYPVPLVGQAYGGIGVVSVTSLVKFRAVGFSVSRILAPYRHDINGTCPPCGAGPCCDRFDPSPPASLTLDAGAPGDLAVADTVVVDGAVSSSGCSFCPSIGGEYPLAKASGVCVYQFIQESVCWVKVVGGPPVTRPVRLLVFAELLQRGEDEANPGACFWFAAVELVDATTGDSLGGAVYETAEADADVTGTSSPWTLNKVAENWTSATGGPVCTGTLSGSTATLTT